MTVADVVVIEAAVTAGAVGLKHVGKVVKALGPTMLLNPSMAPQLDRT